ncbi:MAG: TIGR04255 family protein [Rhodomicrobium sp.]
MSKSLSSAKYARAPITEAVIDIRSASVVSAKNQETVVRRLKRLYPNSNALQAFSVNIDTTGGHVGLEQRPQGYRLSSDEQTDVVLVMPSGIATARLAPYPGWVVFKERSEFVWQIWRKSTTHHAVARIGVRTINRIDVPVDNKVQISLQTYLNFYPRTPALSSTPMLGYMMQVILSTSTPKWTATVTSTLISPPPLLNHTSLLLDIDIFRTEEIPSNDTELWEVIEQARAIKNDIFERCITNETRKLIS